MDNVARRGRKARRIMTIANFSPHAYYDKTHDHLRVELRDCSITEDQINDHLTVLRDNYPGPSQSDVAGLMIGGISRLFTELEIHRYSALDQFLGALLERLPHDSANAHYIRPVQQLAANIEIPVRLQNLEAA